MGRIRLSTAGLWSSIKGKIGYSGDMGGGVHKHGGKDSPDREEGGPDHLGTHTRETYWHSAAKKTLIDEPVKTWRGAAHKEDAARLTKKAKDLEAAVGSGSMAVIDRELEDLKMRITILENKLKDLREEG